MCIRDRYIYLQHGSILVYMSPHRQTCQPLDNCNLLCYRLTMMNRDNDCGQASSQRLIVRQTRLKQLATSPAALPLLAYRVAPKTGPLCFVRLNFFYNLTPFWNLFHCQNQEIILSLTITPHLKCVNWKQDDVCNNTFKSASSTARRTHWTFDVITAGCDSYFR